MFEVHKPISALSSSILDFEVHFHFVKTRPYTFPSISIDLQPARNHDIRGEH